MATEELTLKVTADTKAAENKITGLASHVESKSKKMGTSMKNAGKKMTTGLTLPIVGFLGASVKAFTTQEDATKKLSSAFESTGAAAWTSQEALMANADALQQLTTHGDEAIEEMQSVLLTFTQIKGQNFDGAQMAILNLSDALGQDLQSSATMVGKALNDPIAGISAMSRAGITFSQEQKDTIKSMVEMGDTAGAQAIMLGELETQFGGTAEAMAETSSGQMKQAMNTLGDSMETIGAIVIPILVSVSEFVGKLATKFDNMSPTMQKVIVIVMGVVAALGPLVWIGGILVTVFGAISSAAAFLVPIVLGISLPVLAVVAAIVALIAIGVLLYKNWDVIKAKVIKTWGEIKRGFQRVVAAITRAWEVFWSAIKTVGELALKVIVGYVMLHVNAIKFAITTAITVIRTAWEVAWWAIQAVAETVWSAITGAVDTAVGAIDTAISGVIETVTGAWDTFTGAIKESWDTVWDTLSDGVGQAIDGVVGIVRGALNGMLGALETNINNVIRLLNAAISAYNSIPLAPNISHIPTVSVPRLAEGGMTLNSGPVRVGERGMETINLPAGASVTPGDGGGGISINIERMDGGDPSRIAQDIGWEFAKRGVA